MLEALSPSTPTLPPHRRENAWCGAATPVGVGLAKKTKFGYAQNVVWLRNFLGRICVKKKAARFIPSGD
mgnify:CR=1 FL=1